jgi:hypothetical protein
MYAWLKSLFFGSKPVPVEPEQERELSLIFDAFCAIVAERGRDNKMFVSYNSLHKIIDKQMSIGFSAVEDGLWVRVFESDESSEENQI